MKKKGKKINTALRKIGKEEEIKKGEKEREKQEKNELTEDRDRKCQDENEQNMSKT